MPKVGKKKFKYTKKGKKAAKKYAKKVAPITPKELHDKCVKDMIKTIEKKNMYEVMMDFD